MTQADVPGPPHPDRGELVGRVAALGEGTRGRWLVTSQGSQHVRDLDAMTYQRLPGPGRKRFAYDGDAHRITRVEAYPALGRSSIVFFDDPLRPWMEQWRVCSTICSITPLPASESTRGVPNDGDECGPSGEE